MILWKTFCEVEPGLALYQEKRHGQSRDAPRGSKIQQGLPHRRVGNGQLLGELCPIIHFFRFQLIVFQHCLRHRAGARPLGRRRNL